MEPCPFPRMMLGQLDASAGKQGMTDRLLPLVRAILGEISTILAVQRKLREVRVRLRVAVKVGGIMKKSVLPSEVERLPAKLHPPRGHALFFGVPTWKPIVRHSLFPSASIWISCPQSVVNLPPRPSICPQSVLTLPRRP